MNPVENYFRELYDIRSTGAAVPETSYYPALSNLLNAIGQSLKPKVRCVINLKNRGAGIPDGGLFTPDQFQRGGDGPVQGQLPARGAIEVKPTSDDAFITAGGQAGHGLLWALPASAGHQLPRFRAGGRRLGRRADAAGWCK